MVFILLFQLLVTSAYSLAIPSLYKFVTTPTELPDELVCSEVVSMNIAVMVCLANIDNQRMPGSYVISLPTGWQVLAWSRRI